MNHLHVGFIGGGNMASSIITGLLAKGLPADHIRASDPDPARLESLRQIAPLLTSTSNADAIAGADIVILAVKPQVMTAVLEDILPRQQGQTGGGDPPLEPDDEVERQHHPTEREEKLGAVRHREAAGRPWCPRARWRH